MARRDVGAVALQPRACGVARRGLCKPGVGGQLEHFQAQTACGFITGQPQQAVAAQLLRVVTKRLLQAEHMRTRLGCMDRLDQLMRVLDRSFLEQHLGVSRIDLLLPDLLVVVPLTRNQGCKLRQVGHRGVLRLHVDARGPQREVGRVGSAEQTTTG